MRLFLLFLYLALAGCIESNQEQVSPIDQSAVSADLTVAFEKRFRDKAKLAKTYCEENNLNTDVAILIDMQIHSGKNRLFIVNLETDSIQLAALCSHGCGEAEWGQDETKTKPVFSNVHESHCSSLGKYRVGKRGHSSWGINVNYKLHGLETSNSNAYDRFIVLHSWEMVSEREIFPQGTPEGWGCPAVSNQNMRYIDWLLKQQDDPVLLWIYS